MERLALEAQQREEQKQQGILDSPEPAEQRTKPDKPNTNRPRKMTKSISSSNDKDKKPSKKKQKLYCVCRMPYDEAK